MDHRGRGHRPSPLGAVSPGDGAVGVAPPARRWPALRSRGRASAFHSRAWPDPLDRPQVWLFDVSEPALVLGSTQSESVVDPEATAAAGLEVVRRQSGGGAVLVRPGDVVWIDVLVPAGDPLWETDVSRAFYWVGHTWVEALRDLGIEGARAHHGPMHASPWSSLVCFAGLGPGEVTLADGRKVVGMSQRRRRSGALFQCAALLRWEPSALLEGLSLGDDERSRAGAELAGVANGLGIDGGRLEQAFLGRLADR